MKVIWKFKNNNKKIQYHVCIFLGNVVTTDNNIKKILKKIKDLNFFDTLMAVTENEYKLMSKYYGDKWYTYFFNSKHITFMINNIRNTKTKKEDILEKYGEEWFKKNIADFEYIGKTQYNYAYLYKQSMERKNKNLRVKDIEQDDDIDYTISSSNVISNIAKFENQIGGTNTSDTIDMS